MVPSKRWEGRLDELANKRLPPGTYYEIIDSKDIPPDREVRDAWELKDRKIKVNTAKADAIRAAKLKKDKGEPKP